MKRFIPTAALLSLLAAGASAQPLDLATAMSRAREAGREVASAAARQAAAEARADQATGHRLPQIRIQEQFIHTDSPADAFALQLNQKRFSFDDFVQGDPNNPEPLDTAITRFEVELPIYTGGEISTRVKQASFAAEAAAADAARTGDRAAVGAAEAWIRLAQAREAVALLSESRDTVEAHVELARSYAEQGMLVRSEVLRAEVELARVDDLLVEAKGNVRLAQANLAYRLSDPLDTDYELAKLPAPPSVPGAREEWIAAADGRRDLEAARKQLAAGELEADALFGALLPRIGVVGRYDLVDDKLFGSHGDSTTIVAVASFDLFDGGKTRAAMAAARADAEAGRADVERFVEGVRLEAKQAWEAAEVALERQQTAASALAASEEALRIVEERFRSGVVKTLDVLDASNARREADMRELVARAEAWLAHFRLALAAGRSPEAVLTLIQPIP